MFKNLTLARFSGLASLTDAELHAQAVQFVPCGPTQTMSSGFVPPRREHGALIEAQAGHWILAVKIETRSVPAAAIQKRVDEMAATIEDQTGRKPGKKQRRQLKDDALLEMLPHAFPKSKRVLVWLNTATGLLAVDTASASVFDAVTMLLAKTLPGLQLEMPHTTLSPASAMAGWLLAGAAQMDGEEPPAAAIEPPDKFTIDRECELKAPDESKAVVRYARHPLDTDEVRLHLLQGKRPTRLALTWNGRVSFVMTDQMVLRKIELLDGVFAGMPPASSRDADEAFDADVAIFTGEAQPMLAELIDALGGLMTVQPMALASDDGANDPLYDQAVAVVLEHQRASISLVQRVLAIGYNRAARLLEAMEVRGLVSPMDSGGNRTVKGGAA